ncbi:MAG: 50S ribosomal protein L4 [Candidatus Zambryskibacteria bacterium RIFCSPHIGHO2_01_FULL_43_27]|uniref:Large ribosomal subunit protein uL4 n=1 Tax=Candidatus Zambryskibacteria bacterium RIFCSPLOWO2_01_FULL_43_17 TaxID=1802760 RepID=A0A1G2U407_9BACT|nr:MAG: 50S ribosomal protein L4 [Candidatus Zambryskibacteria bacterium RIFCSPHIGHO2_01_FULL_43_27]OHB04248.1 MAG: 50S ribosomal protein L4 [Candidatus Zambryskibacteria bacterium RIFCSPLOWO2_01_FULL_43_17]
METSVYNQKGENIGKIALPKSIFGVKWNSDLVHQVVTSMQSSARRGTAHTKTRGEVRGGGKKPWKQKGTGQARHGSTRSPIWVGGGVAHGPRTDKNYDRKINKKMKTKALFAILSRKLKDDGIVFVDDLTLKEPKTKLAIASLVTLGKVPALKNILNTNNALSIYVPERTDDLVRAFRNVANVTLEDTRSMNPVSLLSYKKVVMVYPEESLRILGSKLGVAKEETSSKTLKKVMPVKEKKTVKKVAKAKAK